MVVPKESYGLWIKTSSSVDSTQEFFIKAKDLFAGRTAFVEVGGNAKADRIEVSLNLGPNPSRYPSGGIKLASFGFFGVEPYGERVLMSQRLPDSYYFSYDGISTNGITYVWDASWADGSYYAGKTGEGEDAIKSWLLFFKAGNVPYFNVTLVP